MNQELIEAKAASLENVTSDHRWGFIQGAHWANEQAKLESEKAAKEYIAARNLLDAQPVPEDDRMIWPEKTEPLIGCVNHDCAKCKDLESQEPVALQMIKGELCYLSQHEDQSFGMWCPVTPSSNLPFANGTNFYTHPPQRTEQDPVANELAQLKEEIALLKYKLWDCEEKSKPMQGQ